MSPFAIEPTEGPFGAFVLDLDLRAELTDAVAEALRAAWLRHQVLIFPEQDLGLDDLERVASAFGPIGADPFFVPIGGAGAQGARRVVELVREATETSPLFADVWHSDWSFLPSPPAGTLLYGVDIPPIGGDTLFADQYAAVDALPEALRARVKGLVGIHSARRGYSRQGLYGDRDTGRSMAIVSSDDALATQAHPVIRTHPETGRPALFVSLAYTIGIEGLDDDEANALIGELYPYTCGPDVVLRHTWEPGMVVLWDNRCLLHSATGGYEGHRRSLHRLTIAERSVRS